MHPILVHVPTPWGQVPIYSYGVMLGLSLIVAWYLIMWLGTKSEGLSRELMSNTFIVTAICSILGARMLYIITNPDDFQEIGKIFQLRSGGLVAYGGFLGGFFGSWGYLRWKKVPLLPWADVVTPTLCTGLFFTRIGCYLYGCDFGGRLSEGAPGWLETAGTFPRWTDDISPANVVCAQQVHGSPAWSHHVQTYGLDADATASFAVHPTQLYESAAGLALFAIAMLVWRRRQFRGQVLTVIVLLYSIWRYLIEIVRDDPERGAALGMSTSQIIALLLVPVAVMSYVILRKRELAHGPTVIPAHALEPAASDGPDQPPSSVIKRTKTKKRKKRK